MSRILYLKELVFSLEEIKNYDEEQVKEKIEEYKQKIIKLEGNIKTLYLMENGKKYWVVSWRKNCIYIEGRKNPYEIENNLMYVEILYPEDNSILICTKSQEPRLSKYTKNYILNLSVPDTMCNYIYNRINGKEYITVEWKTDDYIYGKNYLVIMY